MQIFKLTLLKAITFLPLKAFLIILRTYHQPTDRLLLHYNSVQSNRFTLQRPLLLRLGWNYNLNNSRPKTLGVRMRSIFKLLILCKCLASNTTFSINNKTSNTKLTIINQSHVISNPCCNINNKYYQIHNNLLIILITRMCNQNHSFLSATNTKLIIIIIITQVNHNKWITAVQTNKII